MIYEFRTYNILPRSLPEVLKRFEEPLAKRQELSKLWGFFHTEIGPLNQICHVWIYKDLAHRAQVRKQAVDAGIWPPKMGDYLLEMQSDIYEPLPFATPLEAGNHGPYYEMRIYTLKAGAIPSMAAAWKEKLPGRLKVSPLAGVFTSEIGGLNKWMHIWPYKTLQARDDARKAAIATGQWPPSGTTVPLRQENKMLLAAKFSPMG